MSLIPILVGLPGAGKSSIVRTVGARLGLEVFESDPFFRVCRALPPGTNDPRRAITERFVDRVRRLFPESGDAVAADAAAVDDRGQCILHDGKHFRDKHGEDVFRAYEIEMLCWTWKAGELARKIPDLSASAPRFVEVRDLFSPANGYLPVLVDTPRSLLCRNLLADYARVVEERDRGRPDATIRGGYEAKLDAALIDLPPGNSSERARVLLTTVAEIVDQDTAQRMETYRKFALRSIVPSQTTTVAACAEAVIALVAQHAHLASA